MARGFRFRLEVVRRIRERERDAQRRALAHALRAVGQVEERIDRLTGQLAESFNQTRGVHASRHVDVTLLRGHQLHRGWLHRRILESNAELAVRNAGLEQDRSQLAEASKRLKVIESLRERQWARHRRQVAREEQIDTDEVAVQMYLRHGPRGAGIRQ